MRLRKNKNAILIDSVNLNEINIIDYSDFFSNKDEIALKKALDSRKVDSSSVKEKLPSLRRKVHQ